MNLKIGKWMDFPHRLMNYNKFLKMKSDWKRWKKAKLFLFDLISNENFVLFGRDTLIFIKTKVYKHASTKMYQYLLFFRRFDK